MEPIFAQLNCSQGGCVRIDMRPSAGVAEVALNKYLRASCAAFLCFCKPCEVK